jgi:hypothetical protein
MTQESQTPLYEKIDSTDLIVDSLASLARSGGPQPSQIHVLGNSINSIL